jgi:hypothetical protein
VWDLRPIRTQIPHRSEINTIREVSKRALQDEGGKPGGASDLRSQVSSLDPGYLYPQRGCGYQQNGRFPARLP